MIKIVYNTAKGALRVMNPEITVNRVEHVRVSTEKPFAEVVRSLEAATGLFEREKVEQSIAAGSPPDVVREIINGMAGESGFMRLGSWDHGAVLRQMGHEAEAIRFAIGHPLIAARMTQHQISSALYAPLSVLVAGSNAGGTAIECDRPSTLFQQFHDARVMECARELDDKLASLVHRIAIGDT